MVWLRSWMTSVFVIAFVSKCLGSGVYDLYPIDIPAPMQACFDNLETQNPLTDYSGYSVSQDCIAQYTWRIGNQPKRFDKMIVDGDWYDKLLDAVKPKSRCYRRGPKRVRKEIRQLSRAERRRYFQAILQLKSTPFRDTNRYDWFVRLHSGMTMNKVRFGCSFLSFVRVFTLMFEEALRQIDPSVTVPYFDTSIDDGMMFSAESVVWDKEFFGRGDGMVTTGYFANSQTPFGPFFRNIAQEDQGDLISRENVKNVLSQSRLSQIVQPNAPAKSDMNEFVSSYHRWHDGQYVTLNQSVVDPVFFSIFAYADKIFEQFSQNQKSKGINPETDYPGNCKAGRRRNDELLPGISNIDGRSSYYNDCVYDYSELPETCTKDNQCGGKFYTCGDDGYCTSKRWQDVKGFSGLDVCKSKLVPPSIQTGYWIDGFADKRQWGFIPVEVNYEFPPEKVVYNNFPVFDNKFDTTFDIYNIPGIEKYQQTNAARHQKCAEPPTINIESNGLSYAGLYKDFGLPDTRVAMSQTLVYIAVKKPTQGEDVDFFMSGYDTCGRICKPFCRTRNMRRFRPCSGAMRLSSRSTLAGNLLDVVEQTWNIRINARPEILSSKIFVSFLCDADSQWIWNRSRNFVGRGSRSSQGGRRPSQGRRRPSQGGRRPSRRGRRPTRKGGRRYY